MSQIFKHRNVPLSMVTLLCAMTGVFVLSAVMPNYLVDYLKLTGPQMGFVTSAIGFGGALGQFGLLTVSDFIGRRTTTMVSFIVAAVFLWFFIHTGGANLPMLFGLLFVAAMFNFGALAILAGPIPAEAAPVGLIASAAGIVIGAGEIFGGGVAPSIAGAIAQGSGFNTHSTLPWADRSWAWLSRYFCARLRREECPEAVPCLNWIVFRKAAEGYWRT